MEGSIILTSFKSAVAFLVSQVNRVFERDIPDRKRLKFGIAGFHAAFILVIKLRQAGDHLTASGTGAVTITRGL